VKRALAALCVIAALIAAGSAKADAVSAAKTESVPAQAAYLIEANSGRVLLSQNADARLPMASTTKIMTALLAVESERLKETVTVPKEAAGTEGSSMYLKAGEKIPLIDLVYGLMLTSGNDAAVAIACFLDGDTDAFAARMNARAEALGLKDTHFVTPNGLHDPNHYTTAHDLALLAAAALDNPTFAMIVQTKYRDTEGDVLHKLKNKNRLLWEYEGGIGVKTGYTKAAGKCLVFAAERGGMKPVGVVLNCPSMWNTAKSMLDAAFQNYRARTFLTYDTFFSVPVQDGVKKTLCAAPKRSILYPTEIDGDGTYTVDVALAPTLCAPVPAGQTVGTATLYRNGIAVCTVPVAAIETVEKVGFLYYFRRTVSDFAG